MEKTVVFTDYILLAVVETKQNRSVHPVRQYLIISEDECTPVPFFSSAIPAEMYDLPIAVFSRFNDQVTIYNCF